ncbi:hypothetical protein [Parasphingopyxis lamellibrachiae]|uniref:Uncharacterized protein n=1 Tax=Parasphingopyxis lamellibrachiae TaxID=680125 RepID=A0A3D9FEK4_9SPHN|nr:hypothetical protein [Parasphingopyxis lamellibrachiae]RED16219.1 hypothetical protein DFR46_1236 [Parasphingopyxis lamellibrachiae]
MKKTMIVAFSMPAIIELSACASEETASTDSETIETSADGAYDADPSVDAGELIADEAPQADAGDGTRLSIGPDGARLDVESDNIDASVGNGEDSVAVEF